MRNIRAVATSSFFLSLMSFISMFPTVLSYFDSNHITFGTVFWDNRSPQDMLNLVEFAESQLKFFIYPIREFF